MKRLDVNQIDTHTYVLDVKSITGEGVVKNGTIPIRLCRGSKLGEGIERQDGVFTEQLLTVCLEFLESVNVGDLRSRDNSIAITHIENALLMLKKRQDDRANREVAQTYGK